MTDDRLTRTIGNLLRAGVALAAVVVLAGGAWYLAASGDSRPDYRQFRAGIRGVHSLAVLPRAEAVILIGLLILMVTPVARVIFSLVAFALERDRLYVGLTAVVLVVLLYSMGRAWW